jgi:signal transduction histidine kinase
LTLVTGVSKYAKVPIALLSGAGVPVSALREWGRHEIGSGCRKPGVSYTKPSAPIGSLFFTAFLVLVLGLFMILRTEQLKEALYIPLGQLAFWTILVLAMNLIPFNEGDRSFTLDTPILLAVALLYPPELACLVAFVGSFDLREVLGRVTFWRALFNRTQISLSVLLAGVVFRWITHGRLDPWTSAAIGTAIALLAFHAFNVLTVGTYTALRTRAPIRLALSSLTIGPVGSFLATYLGYGVLALVLAHLFVDVGAWSVALFLIPLLVARQMLVRGEALENLARELRHRERLLERLFDRIVEERRDERLRIANGLHDDVLQSIVRMAQLGSFLKDEVPADSVAGRDVRELSNLSQETIESIRRVVSDLQRSPVGRGGLVQSLVALAQDLQIDWRTQIKVSADESLVLAPPVQMVGYQATREAIMNSLKHASASVVRVTCSQEESQLVIIVADDGRGFEPRSVDESRHFGLGLMRRRVELAGGTVEVNSGLSRGTTVSISLPVPLEGTDATGSDPVLLLPERQTGREDSVHPAPSA